MALFRRIKSNLKFWLIIVSSTLFFLWWISNAQDLLWQLTEPTYEADMTVKVGQKANSVWTRFFWNSTEIDVVVEKQIRRDGNGRPLCHGGECPPECNGTTASEKLEQCKYQHIWVEVAAGDKPSIITKATRILLLFVIALSVTMILYNGMMYIIQTWQWKEAKDLTKNIAYIVIWILIALFSVVIITLTQSIPSTLEDWWETSGTEIKDSDLLK